jgi:hypothetical protein
MRRKVGTVLLIAAAALVLVSLAAPRGRRVTPFAAPAFSRDPAAWINSVPVGPGDGRVYLVEVWSYG